MTASPSSLSTYSEIVDKIPTLPILDKSSLVTFFEKLEKAIIENSEQRLRHAQEPIRFFDSEVALYELVSQLGAAAADYELLGLISEDRCLAPLLPLTAHPNEDIAAAVLCFLIEATDTEDVSGEEAKFIWQFVHKLVILAWNSTVNNQCRANRESLESS